MGRALSETHEVERERQLPAAGRRTGSPDCRPGRRPEGDTDKEPETVVTPTAALNTSLTSQLVQVEQELTAVKPDGAEDCW